VGWRNESALDCLLLAPHVPAVIPHEVFHGRPAVEPLRHQPNGILDRLVKHYIVTRKSDGAIVYRYQHTEPVSWQGMEFATHDHAEEAPPSEPPPPPEDRRVTLLGFRNRFTKAEKIAIDLASIDNPAAPMAQRQMAASLRADIKDQENGSWTDLDLPETRDGVQQLEQFGLIAAGRAAMILDAPITEVERYRERSNG
jgi:hypothetical protein